VNYTRKVAPTTPVVDLAVLKEHVRIDQDLTDQDAVLLAYHDAACEWVSEYTGRSLTTETWQMSLCGFPERVELPRAAPLQSLTFVKYYTKANVLTTLSASVYTLPAFAEPAVIRLADTQVWPDVYDREDAVQVEYVTGATTASDVPAPLRQAVQLLVGHWCANRESVIVGTNAMETPMAVESLCAPYRLFVRRPEWT